MEIGHRIWAIPEGYIPSRSSSGEKALASHETVCIPNVTDRVADIAITLFLADREPAGPFRMKVPARRTMHLRFDNLRDPETVPRDTDYASVIESSELVIVQHTPLDSRDQSIALLSTVAFAGD